MIEVAVRFHAGLRDVAGCRSTTVQLPEGSRDALLAALVEAHPTLARHLARARLAVDDAFADGPLTLRDGSEVDVMPPVAGGSGAGDGGEDEARARVLHAEIVERPLGLDALYDAVVHPAAGAVTLFVGVVRDHADGAAVETLRYEHHERLARAELHAVLTRVARAFPGARLAAEHRVGTLQVGDRAVVVAASAPHRDEAFAAGREAIDRIKESVPIWKHETGPTRAHWVRLEEG